MIQFVREGDGLVFYLTQAGQWSTIRSQDGTAEDVIKWLKGVGAEERYASRNQGHIYRKAVQA